MSKIQSPYGQQVLARFATRVFTAFPDVLSHGHWVGNPLRAAFLQVPDPATRFAGRSGPLKLLCWAVAWAPRP